MADNTASLKLVFDEAGFAQQWESNKNKVAADLVELNTKTESFSASTRRAWKEIPDAVRAGASAVNAEQARQAALTLQLKEAQMALAAAYKVARSGALDAAQAAGLLGSAEQRVALISHELAAAQTGVAVASHHSISDVTAASAAVRTLEGGMHGSVRAAERFLVTTLGLGSLLQVAFPVFGALSLADALIKITLEAGKALDNILHLTEANKALDELELKLAKDGKQFEEHLDRLKVKYIEMTQGAAAAARAEEAFLQKRPIDLSKIFDEQAFRKLPDLVKGDMERVFKAIDPTQADQKIAEVKQRIGEIKTILAGGVDSIPLERRDSLMRGVDISSIEGMKVRLRIYQDVLRELSQETSIREQEITNSHAQAAQKQREEDEKNIASLHKRQEALAKLKKLQDDLREAHLDAQADQLKTSPNPIQEEAIRGMIERQKKANQEIAADVKERKKQEFEATKIAADEAHMFYEQQGKDAEQLANKRVQAAELALEGETQTYRDQLTEQRSNAEFLYSTNQISYQKRLELLRDAIDKERELEIQQLNFKKSLYAKDPAEVQRIENQIRQIIARSHQQEIQLDQQAALRKQQLWQNTLQKLNSMFDTSINGFLQGTQTFQQTWIHMLDSMVLTAAKSLEQMLAQWIFHHEAKNAISLKSALKELTHHAMNAAGATWKAVAAIPIIGPVLAPPAAAAAFAGVMALGALASARNGMVSEEEQMAFIHKNEMVLPAPLSMGFQSIIGRMNDSSTGSGSGDVHLHLGGNTFNGNSPEDVFQQHERSLIRTLRRLHRQGSLNFA
jgi:hypothetical protein